MAQEFSVPISKGGCTDCTNCGLCGKGKEKKIDVITESPAAPKKGEPLCAAMKMKTVAAVDIGTTTVAMYLINEENGEQVGVFTALNPQGIHGSDVISRICNANEGKRFLMQSEIRQTVENGIKKLCKEELPEYIVISGNTVMCHLFMGMDVKGLGVYPFRPISLEQQETKVCGIRTILMPGISAFLGGDIVSGLYSRKMTQGKEITFLIDLGTNAEMVLGNCDKMIATSAAAGPAFDQKVLGAQLISAVATLLEEGKIDFTGCLADEYFESGCKVGRTIIRQEDIRNLQKAKAAVAAGIQLLMKEYPVNAGDIHKIYIAGGLGFYMDLDAAIRIGLFPKAWEGKIEAVGNTSLEGAYQYACALRQNKDFANELAQIIAKVTEHNLSEMDEFENTYIAEMNF